jgi:hypothetical protein
MLSVGGGRGEWRGGIGQITTHSNPHSPCLSFRCVSGGGSMKKFCFRRCNTGVSGHQRQKMPVEESPMRSRSPTFCVTMRRPGLERRACTCGQRIWQRDISFRSRGALSAMAAQTWAVLAAAVAGRDSGSATTFHAHGTYISWFVRPEVGGETLLRAKIKGL